MFTHFILIYSVPYRSFGSTEIKKDYCEAAIREMKYLEKLTSCTPSENVAVFKIKWKQNNLGYDAEGIGGRETV